MRRAFNLNFKSEISSLRSIVENMLSFLRQNYKNVSQEDFDDLKLIFSELLCNAIIHGNKLDNNKEVVINIEINHDMLYVKISDEGCGFNHEDIACIDNDSENGRGIKIVTALTDEFNFLGHGNAVEFHKRMK